MSGTLLNGTCTTYARIDPTSTSLSLPVNLYCEDRGLNNSGFTPTDLYPYENNKCRCLTSLQTLDNDNSHNIWQLLLELTQTTSPDPTPISLISATWDSIKSIISSEPTQRSVSYSNRIKTINDILSNLRNRHELTATILSNEIYDFRIDFNKSLYKSSNKRVKIFKRKCS